MAAVVTIKFRGPVPVDNENFLVSVFKDTLLAPDQSTPRFQLEVTREEKRQRWPVREREFMR